MAADAKPAADTTANEDAWTIGRLLKWTTEYLAKCGSLSPRLDAEVLLAHVRGCERIMLYTAFEELASDDIRAAFRELVRQRAEGTPVAYLVGAKEFYSLRFQVNNDVLIPRPETEFLVLAALDIAKEMTSEHASDSGSSGDSGAESADAADAADAALDVLEIGAGSGAVSVTIAHELPTAQVTATDISPAALRVAVANAESNHVADRVTFIESDLLSGLPDDATFDLIVSNPPYVSAAEMEKLPRDVKDHEPHVALLGGDTGLELTERLLQQALPRLRPGGGIAIETSPMLAERLQTLMGDHPELLPATITLDTSGLSRIVAARRIR